MIESRGKNHHVGKIRLSDAARTLKRRSSEAIAELKGAGKESIRARQLRAADKIGEYEAIAYDAAHALREKKCPALADRVQTIASASNRVRDYLNESAPEEIWHDAEDSIRKHSTVAFAGFLLAGLAAGRFLKSSARKPLGSEVDL